MSKNDMVMVPRDLVEGAAEWLESLSDAESAEREVAIALRGALRQQHQGEPVALPERRPDLSIILGEHHDPFMKGQDIGWNACLDAIAKLGPLYTHADPAEVERLRAAADHYCTLSNRVIEERESLRAQLAERDALLRDIKMHGSDCYVVGGPQMRERIATLPFGSETNEKVPFDPAKHVRAQPGGIISVGLSVYPPYPPIVANKAKPKLFERFRAALSVSAKPTMLDLSDVDEVWRQFDELKSLLHEAEGNAPAAVSLINKINTALARKP